jgi:isopenicillin-N N-acyltransferase-like protein
MTLPIIDLQGSAYDGGVQHGRAAADLIGRNLEIYYDRFQRETRLPPQEVRDRAMRYLAVIDARDPEYGQAMRGVSDGARLPLADVAVLNARYEILYSQYSMINQGEEATLMVDGCTAFAVTPDASSDGHLYLGQNWDWFPQVQGVVVRMHRSDGFALAAFTEAGIVGGKIGMNSRGIGLLINGLLSNKDDWRRLRTPFHVRTWQILQAQTLDEAASVITREGRSCSANFLLGQANGTARVMNIEAAPDAVCTLQPRGGTLAHANHFVDPDALQVWQPLAEDRTTTYQRGARMHELLEAGKASGKLGTAGLLEILRDHGGHPDSVCRHPNPRLPEEQRVKTVVSVLEDLTARRFYVAGGTPCITPFQEITLP